MTTTTTSRSLVLALVPALTWGLLACSQDEGSPDDLGESSEASDADFLGADGKGDSAFGDIDEGSAHALGVLRAANELSLAVLDDVVPLDTRAAHGIVGHRLGPDGVALSGDDDPISSLAELDAVAWVGPAAFKALLDYAVTHGLVSERSYEVVMTDPFCDECQPHEKAWLRTHSRIIEAVVREIDAAESRIDVAQFTFSVTEIADALHRALDRGVDLRIAIDSGQTENTNVARLADAGANVRFVSGRPAGASSYGGLQHAKFMRVDDDVLVNGSNNWSSTGTTINEENTVVVRAAAGDSMLSAFDCYFEAMWTATFDTAGECGTDEVSFSPGSHSYNFVRAAIREAEHSIDVLMHHFTFDRLMRDLAQAAERGVRVRIVINEGDLEELTRRRYWARLAAAGAELRLKQVNEDAYQLQHHKLAIIDGRILMNGSGNWSGSALFNNYENFVRYEDAGVVDAFAATFERIWSWSLTPESVEQGRSAADQHLMSTRVYFGNLHAHFNGLEGSRMLDDGRAQRADEQGELSDVPEASGADAARYAFEYARDRGQLDFLLLSAHSSDENPEDSAVMANMTESGFASLLATAESVTAESGGQFLALAGSEWATNSVGNHVNIIGTGVPTSIERGAFDALYEEHLPQRAALGERPFVQLNHPRTFPRNPEDRRGKFDQLYDVPLTEMERDGDRRQLFNDYGVDDYPPLSLVRDDWVDGRVIPDRETVNETLRNLEAAAGDYLRLMEVTIGRGNEIAHEGHQNPSLVEDDGTGAPGRYDKVHADWDYYLLRGFRLAPAANHDNHYANWGTGHSTRTAVVAEALDQRSLFDAIDRWSVYASEDENLELRVYAEDRVPAGASLSTLAPSLALDVSVVDPDYQGVIELSGFRGRLGGERVDAVFETTVENGAWTDIEVELPESGEHFVYIEVFERDAQRYAWSSPIWVERLD